MQIFERRVSIKSRSDIVYLVGLFDLHIGNAATAEDKIQEAVEWIKKTPNAYWFAGGDMIEGILPDDKRWVAECQKNDAIKELGNALNWQIERVFEMLDPIRDKCLWWMSGNHEDKIEQRHCINVSHVLAHRFNVPNGKFNAYVSLKIDRIIKSSGKHPSRNIKIFASHGGGGGIKMGATINRIIDLGGIIDADIYIAGHDHKDISAEMPLMTMSLESPPRIVERQRLFIRSAAYLKTYAKNVSGYGEKKWYQPVNLGSPIIAIKAFPSTSDKNNKSHGLPPRFWKYSREQEEAINATL